MLYRRADGKWTVIPLDHDAELGGTTRMPATASFYVGEVGDPHTPATQVNWLKDSFMKTFRAELHARLGELDKTLLAPDNVGKLVNEFAARFSVADWAASSAAKPTQSSCTDPAVNMETVRRWARARHDELLKLERP
jgi:hypothetical protein